MMNIDAHSALTLHRHRSAELFADADRARLARAVVRGGSGPEQPRWWSRSGRRHHGVATRAPALS
ncbi:hypothetical protein [Phytohabitans suffuscus]|uniref:Uncharacterized protein n=1 Tax=Phytohabitans suffuscus TaxID=624315 RepID=A0A6F8YDE4_9ACTN|nr:hypothetical protein [Phytohabitans suffuscus]BCB84053.1 hypothetical protein Psuf_013660 [Phytohabitans suffuscus]